MTCSVLNTNIHVFSNTHGGLPECCSYEILLNRNINKMKTKVRPGIDNLPSLMTSGTCLSVCLFIYLNISQHTCVV